MKNIITYCVAAFMLVWYSLSVIGFDVHTCSDSGKTFIATVISGTACDDIHPEHDEPTCSCCHKKCTSEEKNCGDDLRTKPCCTDDWQMIVLTGLRNGEDKNGAEHSLLQLYAFSFLTLPEIGGRHDFIRKTARDFNKPHPKDVMVRNCNEVYSIWRI